MSQISLQNISKSFVVPHQRRTTLKESFVDFLRPTVNEKFQALQDISLQIPAGQFLGIIGPNGSGKSTLLKIMAQIYRPDQGQVTVQGKVASLLELGIGFQQDLSARDNIFINASLLGLSNAQIRKILPQIVEFSGIGHFLDLKIKNYSSGMRQRLAFAIAAHLDADIYLCDEVFAVGDESFQTKCIAIFQKWREQGKTILLVSHNTAQISELCDRVILLEQGKITADGAAAEVVSIYQQNISGLPRHDFSNSPLRITGVEIFKHQPEEAAQTFHTGDNLRVRINYLATQRIEQPVFGLAIHRDDGVHITGPNTKTSNLVIDHLGPGRGYIDCHFENLSLLAGKYHLTISCFDYACLHAFDYLDKRFSFVVEANRVNQYGLVDLSAIWHLEQE
jgi:ABC-type polysaccharide/polyol phosphate transport system ATPase subunit